MNEKNVFEDMPVIFSYTRAQAIDDGVLVDLTEWAMETGFKVLVACTATVWQRYIVPPEATQGLGQSERGRAHDLLWMLFNAIRGAASRNPERLLFEVIFQQTPRKQKTVTLKAVCGPGDRGEPVLTVMLPDED